MPIVLHIKAPDEEKDKEEMLCPDTRGCMWMMSGQGGPARWTAGRGLEPGPGAAPCLQATSLREDKAK